MSNQDYAILVGINHYADRAFPELGGPLHDLALMKAWLVSPAGGNLDPARIKTIASAEPPPDVPPDELPPVPEEFWREYRRLVIDRSGQLVRRPESRLYLYFSGHGFSQLRDQVPRASLYTANADRYFPASIAGTYYAEAARNAALFRDVVIVMDCCRDAESAKHESIPPILDIFDVSASARIAIFGVYAAPKGGKAQERPIASRGNQIHGLLTHALVDALEHAPGGARGVVTSEDVCNHIRSIWPDVCGTRPADPPEFARPTLGPIDLVTRSAGLIRQRILLDAWRAAEPVELHDGKLVKLAVMTRNDDGAAVTVVWSDGQRETASVTGGAIVVSLAGGLYRLQRGAERRIFQAGEGDVRI